MGSLGLALALVAAKAAAEAPAPDPEETGSPEDTDAGDAAAPDETFFDPSKTAVGEPLPDPAEPEPEPATTETKTAPSATPPMPAVEELENKGAPEKRRPLFDFGPKDRAPAGADGGSFFDPGKLSDAGPAGGAIQVRGFVAANFFVTMRTDVQRRDENGQFEQLKPLPFFDLRSATLYVGAPIYADVVYARIGFEFASIPTQSVNSSQIDVIPQSRRFVYFESGALEVNPFAWAKQTKAWFRDGFKITGGVFIVPFGLEDEDHAAPVNWFITRAYSMTTGRIYPGTWSDAGVTIKWKPTFREDRNPVRPIEIDIGMVNGDACTQTRFIDQLFTPTGLVARCERLLRPGETATAQLVPDGSERIDAPGALVLPDNNGGKSVVTRLQIFPISSINFGGSFIWGTHPEGGALPPAGQSTADLRQAPTWRAGAHVDLHFEEMFDIEFPLPEVRGEFVYGVDEAVERAPAEQTDRVMRGGYVQVGQMLFRRKKTRLPGLILQYRFDQADPDADVPGIREGVPLRSDWSDAVHLRESAIQAHTMGMRFPVLPRFTLKAEYTLSREDGGYRNQLRNDVFGIEAVADF